jgi:hypothetical protein
MAHLLLSLAFLAITAFALKSIMRDLTRPLVMQPWNDVELERASAPVAAWAHPVTPRAAVCRPTSYALPLAA